LRLRKRETIEHNELAGSSSNHHNGGVHCDSQEKKV